MTRKRLAQLSILLAFVAAVALSAVSCKMGPAWGAPAATAPTTQPATAPVEILFDVVGNDGRRLVGYRSPPNAEPPTLNPTAGWETWLPVTPVAGARYVYIQRQLPPQAPPPATRPTSLPLPALTRKVAATTPPGYGLALVNHVAPQTVSDLLLQGYQTNAVVQGCQGGASFRNVRFVGARSAGQFEGQGVYLDQCSGAVTFYGCLFVGNGYAPDFTPTAYRHGAYCNAGAPPPTFDHCVFVANGNSAVQFRNGGTVKDCAIVDCGTGVLAVMGQVTLKHVTIYSAHLYWDGSAWTGATGLQAYCPVTADDVWIVGSPGQASAAPTNTKPLDAKRYPQAAVVTGGTWANGGEPPWVAPPPGPLLKATNCLIAGWSGPGFGGAAKHDGSGFAPKGNPVTYDVSAIMAAVDAGTLSVPDAADRIQGGIRALVK